MVISLRKLKFVLLAVFVCFFSLQIPSVRALSDYSFIYQRVPTLMSVLLLAAAVLKYRKISICTWMLLLYYFFLFGISQLRGEGIFVALTNVCPSMCMILFCELAYRKDRVLLFKVIGVFTFILTIIDLISIIMVPEGMYTLLVYSDCWVLGYKTERINISLPGVVCLAEYSILTKNKIKPYVWVFAVLAVLCAVLSGATAGMFSILFFIVFLIWTLLKDSNLFYRMFRVFLKPNVIFIALMIVNFLVSIAQNLSAFEYIITNVMNKSMQLTGRVHIWDVCKELFLTHPITGCGYVNPTTFTKLTGILGGTQPHNLIWTLLVYTGCLGLILYMGAVLITFNKLDKKNNRTTYIMAYYILANMLLGISSMNTYAPMFTAAIPLLWNLRKSAEE